MNSWQRAKQSDNIHCLLWVYRNTINIIFRCDDKGFVSGNVWFRYLEMCLTFTCKKLCR